MLFEIRHTTDYRYASPASEAYLEARLTPPSNARQTVREHAIEIVPELPTSRYVDSFGNEVDFFSLTLRHDRLAITNRAIVETRAAPPPAEALEVSIAEARQLFGSVLIDYFDYLQPTESVPAAGLSTRWARKFLGSDRGLGEAVLALNTAIFQAFKYDPGSTDNSTPLSEVWRSRRGVCQDFAHVMLGILRAARLPARYVCGYIETAAPQPASGRRLVGSVATHAWVEVLVPGLEWVAFDPTNNRMCGEQHVAVSFGRDSRDAAPVRGTFKGAGGQAMKVRVRMKRLRA